MPTIIRIGTLKIQMYASDHAPPHFHIVNRGRRATVSVSMGGLDHIAGSVSRRDLRIAMEWASEHRKELLDVWQRLNGR